MREVISGVFVFIFVVSFMMAPVFAITGEYDYVLTLLTVCILTGLAWLVVND